MAKQRGRQQSRRRDRGKGPAGGGRRKPCQFCRDKIDVVDYKDFGMLPTEKSVARDAYFQTDFYRPFIQQLPTAKPWPLTADWSKVEDVMWDAVTAALLNTKSAKAALDDACREIDKARGVK